MLATRNQTGMYVTLAALSGAVFAALTGLGAIGAPDRFLARLTIDGYNTRPVDVSLTDYGYAVLAYSDTRASALIWVSAIGTLQDHVVFQVCKLRANNACETNARTRARAMTRVGNDFLVVGETSRPDEDPSTAFSVVFIARIRADMTIAWVKSLNIREPNTNAEQFEAVGIVATPPSSPVEEPLFTVVVQPVSTDPFKRAPVATVSFQVNDRGEIKGRTVYFPELKPRTIRNLPRFGTIIAGSAVYRENERPMENGLAVRLAPDNAVVSALRIKGPRDFLHVFDIAEGSNSVMLLGEDGRGILLKLDGLPGPEGFTGRVDFAYGFRAGARGVSTEPVMRESYAIAMSGLQVDEESYISLFLVSEGGAIRMEKGFRQDVTASVGPIIFAGPNEIFLAGNDRIDSGLLWSSYTPGAAGDQCSQNLSVLPETLSISTQAVNIRELPASVQATDTRAETRKNASVTILCESPEKRSCIF